MVKYYTSFLEEEKGSLTDILCLHSSIVCSKNKEEEEKQEIRKTMKERKKREKTKA
jgi:hypothetical protein